jgi:molecular chaperone DnaK
MPHEIIVGIDLGTTNSLVAIADEAGPRVLTLPGERPLVPSAVRYEGPAGSPRVIVGDDAKARAVQFPLTTITSVKRLMGRSLADASGDLVYLPYKVVEGEHQTARVAVPLEGGERVVSPQEVSASILAALKARAERALGVQVRKAVVTVPAYFDDAQRQATRDAGRLAGLDVVRIVNEPTAAALAYGIGLDRDAARNRKPESVVAVFDLGGGTFDISILRLTAAPNPGETAFFQVLSTAGDTRLGGDDIDHALVALFTRELRDRGWLHPTAEPAPDIRRALKQFAEEVKHRLSDVDQTRVRIDVGDEGGSGGAAPRVYERAITRSELEAMSAPLIDRAMRCCERALRDTARELGAADDAAARRAIDAVVLVGGSTRMPLVRRRVGEFFGLEPYTALDPDQVVALGAAVQGSLLSGAVRGSLLLDVVPLSLGIETVGGAVAKLILRNSPVPARATEMFSTSVDGQTSIKLAVYQGEREMAADCRLLGEFHLRGLPPMPAGIPQVEVEFLVDANGVLHVGATERRTGKRASIQVVPNHGLTRDEVDRMERESFAHAREDMARHRVTDLVVNARMDLKWIGDRLARHGAALDPSARAELERLASELRVMVESAERDWKSVQPDAMHRAKDALDRASVRLQEISITESLRADSPR